MHSMRVEHDYGLSSVCIAGILSPVLRHTGPDGRHQSLLQASISLCCCLKIPDAAESLSSVSLFFRFHSKSFIIFHVSVFPFECLNCSQCFSSDTSEFSLLSYLVSFQLSCFLKHWKQVPSNTGLRSKSSPGTEKPESLGKVTLGPSSACKTCQHLHSSGSVCGSASFSHSAPALCYKQLLSFIQSFWNHSSHT